MKKENNNRTATRNQTTMYLCISKANQDFFEFFRTEFNKLDISFPKFGNAFAMFLLDADESIDSSVTYDTEADTVFDWCSYAKKIYYGTVKSIDYGTVCALKEFFAKYRK